MLYGGPNDMKQTAYLKNLLKTLEEWGGTSKDKELDEIDIQE